MRPYALRDFVAELRGIALQTSDEREILARVKPLAIELAASKSWLSPRHYEGIEAQGNGVYVLHEEADHTLAVVAVCWLPQRETPPHNHGTWAIVAGVDGPERNVFWKRIDDGARPGYAELEHAGEKIVGPGDALAMPSGTIHSVANDTDAVTLTLHVYGRHLGHSERSQFDAAARTESPRRTEWR